VSAWMLMLAPLAVLLVLLLFGFSGCDRLLGLDDIIPNVSGYAATVKGESSLVAYWQLAEPSTTPVPSTGTAIDQQGGRNGNYNSTPINADAKRHSFSAPGTITLGNIPGLLELTKPTDQTKVPCIEVNGGFVEVPFDAVLNPSPFTFEAWVIPEFGSDPANNFYCLVESSAPDGGVQKKLGFGLYAGPANPASVQLQPYQWQVWMGNGQNFQQVAVASDNVKFNQITYLALTYDPGAPAPNLILYLYYPGTGQDISFNSVAKIQGSVTNYRPNNQAGGGSLLIGMGRNLFPGVAVDPVALQPFLYAFSGKIQEVAIYSSALGIEVLANHELAGGMI
jgi:hypothetical protein